MTPESEHLSQPSSPPSAAVTPAPVAAGVNRRRRVVIIIVVAIVAAVVVLCLLCGLGLFVLGKSNLDARNRAGSTASAAAATTQRDLSAAALELWFSPAVRYRGTVTTADGEALAVDVSSTNDGSVLASIDSGKVQLLVASAQTFVRADQAFWRKNGAPTDMLAQYAQQWVKAPGTIFGIDFRKILAPALLAERLAPDTFAEADTPAPAPQISPAGTASVDGKQVQVLRTAGLTIYLSTTEPKRIVRITSGAPALSTPRAAAREMALAAMLPAAVPAQTNASGPGFELNLDDLTEPEVDDLAKRLERKLTELRGSVDSTVRFSIDGNVVLAPCTTRSCTATLNMHNTVSISSPYLVANQPVNASITINMTLDGRPVKSCPANRTMRPNSNATVRCTATYYIPPSRNPTMHTVRAAAQAVARAAVEADIAKMISDLKNDIKQARTARQESGRTPGTPAPAATNLPSAPPCAEPNPGFNSGGPGAWKVFNRGSSSTALWPTYQEQITGVKRTREYFYQGVDFDGYVNEGGNHVFLEAKGRGRASTLKDPETRVAELDARTRQLRSQLQAMANTPGAKLRFVAAEADYLDAVRNHMKTQLPADLYKKIEWSHQPHDFRFKGCL